MFYNINLCLEKYLHDYLSHAEFKINKEHLHFFEIKCRGFTLLIGEQKYILKVNNKIYEARWLDPIYDADFFKIKTIIKNEY